MSRQYFAGSGPVSAREQAATAYREMRRSLIKFAAAELELAERVDRGDELTALQESMVVGRMHAWRDRAQLFASVYLVETSVADRESAKLAQAKIV